MKYLYLEQIRAIPLICVGNLPFGRGQTKKEEERRCPYAFLMTSFVNVFFSLVRFMFIFTLPTNVQYPFRHPSAEIKKT